jgi:hypothetical protein
MTFSPLEKWKSYYTSDNSFVQNCQLGGEDESNHVYFVYLDLRSIHYKR